MTSELRRIKAFGFDVDGVLTNGFTGPGDTKTFHIHDGLGLKLLTLADIAVVVITGRSVAAARERFQGLPIAFYGHVGEKIAPAEEFLAARGLSLEEFAFMGDDLPDVPLMKKAGFSFAPADASSEARSAARQVCRLPGGRGAVREAIEFLLRSQHRWKKVLRAYYDSLRS